MRRLLLLIFLAGVQSTGALAWGVEGHHIVAAIAAANLTPAARNQVRDLLGRDGAQVMVDVATWADEIRSEAPYTFTWHFVNIPVGSAGYDPARDCRYGNCIIAQIERFVRILG